MDRRSSTRVSRTVPGSVAVPRPSYAATPRVARTPRWAQVSALDSRVGRPRIPEHRFGLPCRDWQVGASLDQLDHRACLAGDEAGFGSMEAPGHRVGSFSDRRPDRLLGGRPLTWYDDVHGACPQRRGRGDRPVQHEVRPGQGERGVLGADRLAFAQIDHHLRAAAGLCGRPKLDREREAGAATTPEFESGRFIDQLIDSQGQERTPAGAVGSQRRAFGEAGQEQRPP